MRKLILTLATGFLTFSLFAQSPVHAIKSDKALMMAKIKNATAVPYNPAVKDNGKGIPYNGESFYSKSGVRSGSTIIGTTGYPLQTNGGAMDRVRAYNDGSVSAIWTGSTLTDHAWADRGMFYNHSDGTSWGAEPTARAESVRCGFGGLLTVMDHEVIVSHDGATIRAFGNSEIGGTSWTELGISTMHIGLWPRAFCPAGTDDIYIVSANANPPTAITFSRSEDGGATFALANYNLPYLDSVNCYSALGGDNYQIAVYGSTVYILYGASYADTRLLMSTSNRDPGTWTSETIIPTGLCDYSGEIGQVSDVNGDGLGDTVACSDGFFDMLVDDAGIVHFWSGYNVIIDDDAATAGWSYYPSIGGMWYWNSTMAAASPMYIDLVLDWDGSGDYMDGIGADLGMYDGVTFTSMPNASVDETSGRIYLTYTMPIEHTDYFDDPTVAEAQSFRDIFGTYSDDGGVSWSAPINMTYTAHDHQENVFNFVFDRVKGDCVHSVWMQDDEPGTSLDTNAPDADAMNNMQYRCFDEARFNPYPPTADYDYTPDGALVNFNNLSVDAESYSWDFGDGGSSTAINPAHVYAVGGSYNVCLTAINIYDNDNTCKVIDIAVAVIDIALNQALTVYPAPATSQFTVEVVGNFGELYTEVYNSLGEKVINTTSFTGSVQFDATTMAAGNYIVKVYNNNGDFTSRQITISK